MTPAPMIEQEEPSDTQVQEFIVHCLSQSTTCETHLYHQVQRTFPGVSAEQIERCSKRLLQHLQTMEARKSS